MQNLTGKLANITVATVVLILLLLPMTALNELPASYAVTGGLIFGILLGSFEEFYIQGPAGGWLRRMHPVPSLLIAAGFVMVWAFIAMLANHIIWDRFETLPALLERLRGGITRIMLLSIAVVLVLRVIGFIGLGNLFHLLVGKYHRPVIENKVIAFIDMADSTAIVNRIGAISGKELLGELLSDLSRIVSAHGGEVYIYTGDGLIALWDHKKAIRNGNIVKFARNVVAISNTGKARYNERFGVAPRLRVGIHGGDVVVGEQGDTRRSIGIYGENINIAARLEQAGKELGEACVISADLVDCLDSHKSELKPLPPVAAKGIPEPIKVYGLAN